MSQCFKFTFSAKIFLRHRILLETDLTFDGIKPRLLDLLEHVC